MSAQALFNSLQNNLRIRSWVLSVDGVSGRRIARVGDLFVMNFELTNMAPEEEIATVPLIRFLNPHIIIQPTEFATFPDGSRGQKVHYFPQDTLRGGQRTRIVQQFMAAGELGDIADEFSREKIADVWVVAHVDPKYLFQISRHGHSELEIEGVRPG